MRNRGTLKALSLILPVLIKSIVSKPLYSNGLYKDWDPQTNKLLYCREVLVKRGFEAVQCTKNETEDSIRKCPIGQYQPDETNSSSSPKCMAEPQCTDEGLGKDSKCIDDYCWTVCICSLLDGKCGVDPSNCLDTKNIKCVGKVLQDCSCAPSVITTTLPTSLPTSNFSTIFKPINPDWTTKTLLPIPTDTTKNTDMTVVTKNGTDTGAKGNEILQENSSSSRHHQQQHIGHTSVFYLCVKFRKHCSNGLIGDLKESIEMLGSDPADRNNGLDIDKVSETTDSGVCGLSQGSNENHEPGEADPNSIVLCNGSDMESGRNLDITVRDEPDQEVAQGQSSCQVEVHEDSKLREEIILAEEDDSCQESDQLLDVNECADDPSMRDLSQQSGENSESGETNPNNNLFNGSDDPEATHCKSTSISYSGTNLHHTNGNDAGHHVTDLDPALSLCQLEVQKEPRHTEKPTKVVEDGSLDKEKKVAVVSPFMNEAQTIPVQVSLPVNAETQRLRGEGYPSGSRFSSEGAAANVFSNWSSFSSSIYHDSTNQTG